MLDSLLRLITEVLRSNPDLLRWVIGLLPPPWRPGPRVAAWPLSPLSADELHTVAKRRTAELSQLIDAVERIQIMYQEQGITEQAIQHGQNLFFDVKFKLEFQGTFYIPNMFKFVGHSLTHLKQICRKLADLSEDHSVSGEAIREQARLVETEISVINDSLMLLLMASNPVDDRLDPRIRPENEFNKIKEALNSIGTGTQRISPLPIYSVERQFLPSLLSRHIKSKSIVHISGHGETELIYFQDADGMSRPVSSENLCEILGLHRDYIVLTVLNVCHSDETSKQVASATGHCCIGVAGTISDKGAALFASTFYANLSDKLGDPLPFNEAAEFAFQIGLTTLQLGEGDFIDDRRALKFTNGDQHLTIARQA